MSKSAPERIRAPELLDVAALREFFAAAVVTGLLASQTEEPEQGWVCKWSFDLAEKMVAEALARRATEGGR
jgi:hypothetical protein